MAAPNPANVPGTWYVDDSCFDCDVVRQIAPDLFGEDADGLSYVRRQPATDAERVAAARALLACPVGAVHAPGERLRAGDPFPQDLAPGVGYVGFNAQSSFGANAFLVQRAEGNLLIDAPRWTSHLVRRFEALGGLGHVLLTHRDDVADARRYAERFGARVWFHEADADAAPFATDRVRGLEAREILPGVRCLPVPGHTRGSVCWLVDETYLFTGDSLCWSRGAADLIAFRRACWYSWEAQADSLERLADHRFEWVLAGHGDRARRPADEMRARLLGLVDRMRAGDDAWRAHLGGRWFVW